MGVRTAPWIAICLLVFWVKSFTLTVLPIAEDTGRLNRAAINAVVGCDQESSISITEERGVHTITVQCPKEDHTTRSTVPE